LSAAISAGGNGAETARYTIRISATIRALTDHRGDRQRSSPANRAGFCAGCATNPHQTTHIAVRRCDIRKPACRAASTALPT
jgi:hypothetical protein